MQTRQPSSIIKKRPVALRKRKKGVSSGEKRIMTSIRSTEESSILRVRRVSTGEARDEISMAKVVAVMARGMGVKVDSAKTAIVVKIIKKQEVSNLALSPLNSPTRSPRRPQRSPSRLQPLLLGKMESLTGR